MTSTSDSCSGSAPPAGIKYNVDNSLAFTADLKYNNVRADGDDGTYPEANRGLLLPGK